MTEQLYTGANVEKDTNLHECIIGFNSSCRQWDGLLTCMAIYILNEASPKIHILMLFSSWLPSEVALFKLVYVEQLKVSVIDTTSTRIRKSGDATARGNHNLW